MKVLMYGWEYPPHITGGLGIACEGIVTNLAKLNIEVLLALPNHHKEIASQKNIEILNYYPHETANTLTEPHLAINSEYQSILSGYATRADYFNDVNANINIESLKEFIKNTASVDDQELAGNYGNHLLQAVLNYAKYSSQHAKTKPHDIIYAHDWLTILAGIKAKEISKKPLIFHIHSIEYDRNGEYYNRLIYDIEKYGMQIADKIVTVSQYTKKMVQKFYGVSADKIDVVYNGLPDQYINHPPIHHHQSRTKIVLFLGRITHQKGIIYFINAAHKVLMHKDHVKFVIAGDGDQTRQMIEYVASLKQGKNILFTGFLTQEQVKKMYAISDVYVMPSTSEPFGISCLEALSSGVPIIISKCSGVVEVIKNLLKVDFWDVDGIATKIIALLDYPKIKSEQFYRVGNELNALRWEDTAKKLITIYDELAR